MNSTARLHGVALARMRASVNINSGGYIHLSTKFLPRSYNSYARVAARGEEWSTDWKWY